jgi:uncharacterized damage-inducible protein DinB
LKRPGAEEYAPYYGLYVGQVPEGDVLEILAEEVGRTVALLTPLGETQAGFRYAAGKWSVKEVVGHVIDVERVFAYRALHFARGDTAPLPSMEQDEWARAAEAGQRSLSALLDEFAVVRQATLAMFQGFDPDAWLRRGTASGFEFTVRSLPYLIAGHELHHRSVLETKYLPSL